MVAEQKNTTIISENISAKAIAYILTTISRLDIALCLDFIEFVYDNKLYDKIKRAYPIFFQKQEHESKDGKHTKKGCFFDLLQHLNKRKRKIPIYDLGCLDLFGRVGRTSFIQFLNTWQQEAYNESHPKYNFAKHVEKELCIKTDFFLNDLYNINALRQYMIHPTGDEKYKNISNDYTNLMSSGKIDQNVLNKCFKSLFRYIPIEISNNICQLIGNYGDILKEIRKECKEFNNYYNKKHQDTDDKNKLHKIKLAGFIGKDNINTIKKITEFFNKNSKENKNNKSANQTQTQDNKKTDEKIQKISYSEIIMVFDLILKIHTLFKLYYIPVYDKLKKHTPDSQSKETILRNQIAHSHLFFNNPDKKHKTNYFNQVRDNVEFVLKIFEQNKNLVILKTPLTNKNNEKICDKKGNVIHRKITVGMYIHDFKSNLNHLVNSKNYKYLQMSTCNGDTNNIQTIEISGLGAYINKKFNNTKMEECIKTTKNSKREEYQANNISVKFLDTQKRFFLNIFRQKLKHALKYTLRKRKHKRA